MKSLYLSVFIILIILLSGEAFPQFNLKQNNFNNYFNRHSISKVKKDSLISNYLMDSIVNKSEYSPNSFTYVFNYDDKGRLSYYYMFKDHTGLISYYYDSLGNISIITGPYSKQTNYYDENNNNIYQLFEHPGISQTWVPWMLDSLFYDTSGHIILEKDYNWQGAWGQPSQTFYHYKNGNLDSVLFGSNYYCKLYYNEFASPDSVIWKNWRDTLWADYLDCTYKYDNAGNLISGLRVDLTKYTNDYRFNYSYDKNNCFNYGNNEIKLNGSWVPGDDYFFTSRQDIFQPDVLGTLSNYFSTLSFAGTEVYVYYKLNPNASTSVSGNSNNNPDQFKLSQNYPNPFNPTCSINYSIAKDGNIKLVVFNTLGSKVVTILDEYKQAGNYSVNFNASNLPSGIYFYKLEAGQFSQVKKMILLK